MSTVFDFEASATNGDQVPLADYKGKVLLIVNTASKCGFTPQFEGLQKLFDRYKDQGLEVLGFPCNQFMNQDPGNNGEIAEFCQLNYGVEFPMFSKIDVKGKDAHPLFRHLTKEAPGVLGSKKIKWNFTKFLVNKDGKVVKRYAPTVEPAKIKKDIEKLLK